MRGLLFGLHCNIFARAPFLYERSGFTARHIESATHCMVVRVFIRPSFASDMTLFCLV